jgi:putative selenate reductase
VADLRPYPFDALVRRVFRELDERGSIFDLPAAKFFGGDPERDLSVRVHGHPASSPFGPAAGPHTQMAQNLVLAWLAGGRVVELKTVQVLDDLEIPRPCIDMRTIGFNVEWSQELSLEESVREYMKGAMLVEMLRESGRIDLAPGFDRTIWDLSVGYDLEGIRTDRVRSFLRRMMDAKPVVEEFRRRIPDEWRKLRDLDFPTRLSGTLTLSTFHGCPPDEIERILEHLMREYGLSCTVKLNPLLLGPEETRHLLHDVLGYETLRIPDDAFEKDTKWDQAVEFVERLGETAREHGLGFGVKFTNTLIVEHRDDFLPASEKEKYLSGQPLHVLAARLVERFRGRFGNRFPVSFSAGIDRGNFADAVALGLRPVTVCTDLLRPGGYGRAGGYLRSLSDRMRATGSETIDEFVIRAFGHAESALDRAVGVVGAGREVVGDGLSALEREKDLRAAVGQAVFERWVAEATSLNTETYAERVTSDPRYRLERNTRPPKKIGSDLELFDCITCDKCIPVCPNGANFTYRVPKGAIPVVRVRRQDGEWVRIEGKPLVLERKHQIGNFADLCNDCGNCDVFCPEDGGPYVVKPRFFGSLESFRAADPADGILVRRGENAVVVYGRFDGHTMRLERRAGERRARLSGKGFSIGFDPDDPRAHLEGNAQVEVDLTWGYVLDRIRRGVLEETGINWVKGLVD